jgi:hypothetical protein
MKDWKKIAEASGLRIPEPEMSRMAGALDGLESAFRPLAKSIPHDVEPAVIFRISPEPEE